MKYNKCIIFNIYNKYVFNTHFYIYNIMYILYVLYLVKHIYIYIYVFV